MEILCPYCSVTQYLLYMYKNPYNYTQCISYFDTLKKNTSTLHITIILHSFHPPSSPIIPQGAIAFAALRFQGHRQVIGRPLPVLRLGLPQGPTEGLLGLRRAALRQQRHAQGVQDLRETRGAAGERGHLRRSLEKMMGLRLVLQGS